MYCPPGVTVRTAVSLFSSVCFVGDGLSIENRPLKAQKKKRILTMQQQVLQSLSPVCRFDLFCDFTSSAQPRIDAEFVSVQLQATLG